MPNCRHVLLCFMLGAASIGWSQIAVRPPEWAVPVGGAQLSRVDVAQLKAQGIKNVIGFDTAGLKPVVAKFTLR